MTTGGHLFAVGFGQPVEWLAIAGGAALGAFVCGLVVQLLCRWTTGKKLPVFPLLTMRVLGGVVAGLITAMCVLNGGGNGWWPFGGSGNTGNTGDHPGPTANNDQKPEPATPEQKNTAPQPATPPDRENTAPTPTENIMRVDVMTLEMLDEPAKSQARAGHPYRLPDSADPKALHTLKEVEDAIQTRHDKPPPSPPLQLLVVTGPSQDAGWMQPLIDWAKARHIKVRPESW